QMVVVSRQYDPLVAPQWIGTGQLGADVLPLVRARGSARDRLHVDAAEEGIEPECTKLCDQVLRRLSTPLTPATRISGGGEGGDLAPQSVLIRGGGPSADARGRL